MEEEKSEEVKKRRGLAYIKLIPYLLFVALGVALGIFVAQQKPEWFGLNKGAVAAQAEVDALVSQVGKLIALPTDEKPTVATVTDIEKIIDQPFFKNAQNGDKVLIYQKSQKAILYRPKENRIIEVGILNINNQAVQNPEPIPTPSEKK